jgi:GT2 family glycosyltransferase
VRNQVNLGFGAGCNAGAALVDGDYLAFLNPDTEVTPGWLENLVGVLECNRRAGLATSRIVLQHAPERLNTCGNDMHVSGLTLCRGAGLEHDALPEPGEVAAISGACFAIRRQLFEALGGFDESFFMYVEDADLSLRARLAGYACLYVPCSVIRHDYRLLFGPHKTYYQERNRYLMLLKSWHWATLIVLLPALLLAEVVTWGFVLAREKQYLGNKLRAYASVAAHWPETMRARRRTQALRRVRDRDLLVGTGYRLAFEQTGRGAIARVAHWLFDPLFFLFRCAALALVWW